MKMPNKLFVAGAQGDRLVEAWSSRNGRCLSRATPRTDLLTRAGFSSVDRQPRNSVRYRTGASVSFARDKWSGAAVALAPPDASSVLSVAN